jgi:HlyD family secretion protein
MFRHTRACATRTRLLLVAGLASLATVGCGAEARDLGPSAEVELGRIERIVVATGTVEPEREVEVRPRISGIVQKIHVEAGDRVELDQPLAELDRELLEVQLAEARAEVERANVDLRQAQTELDRATRLKQQGAQPQSALDAATARRDGARAGLETAKARASQFEVQVRYTTIRAPIKGKILDVFIEEGSAVSGVTNVTGGTALLALAEEDKLHLEGLVDENEVQRLAVGQTARVRTEAFGDEVFPGRVRKIAPIGERRQNVTYFEVEVEILGEGAARLRPRMSGDAEIVTEVVEQALIAPETALVYEGDKIFVDVLDDSDPPEAERTAVVLGIADGSRVQITSGVEKGMILRVR